MPFFKAVGYIDDAQFPTPELVMREYRRIYALAAYHKRRDAIVGQLGGFCESCSKQQGCSWAARVVPTLSSVATSGLRTSGAVLVWRSDEAKKKAVKLGLTRINQIATISAEIKEQVLKQSLVRVLCRKHANQMHRGREGALHGAYYAAYKKKCQCDGCGEYRANNALERRETRRAKRMALLSQARAA